MSITLNITSTVRNTKSDFNSKNNALGSIWITISLWLS